MKATGPLSVPVSVLLALLPPPATLAAPPKAAGGLLGAASPPPSEAAARVHPDVGRRLAEAGAPVKVWVFLRDKGYPSAQAEREALRALAASLPERVRTRRALRRTAPGLVDARDLSVAETYVEAIAATGARVHVESRWLNAVSAAVDGRQLAEIARLPFVERVRLVGRSVPLGMSPAGGCVGAGGGFYGSARSQIELSNIDGLHQAGFTGSGVVIAVLDSGFALTHQAFNEPGHAIDVVASYDFVSDDANVGIDPGDDPAQHVHGTSVLGALAAYDPNELVGAAYDASYVLCKTEDITGETQAEEDFFVAGLEFAEMQGADVASSSLGYIDWYTQSQLDGLTPVTTQGVNVATENGVHCCTAAGNNAHDQDPGTSALIAPSDAFNVITCGAVEASSGVAWFTSDGPTADGRVKPEVLAMGDDVATVSPDDDAALSCASGTSLSTPLVAGIVACLTEAHPEWGVATMRNQLTDSGSYLGQPLPDPDFVYGYGIVDALAAHTAPVPFRATPLVPGKAGYVNGTAVIGATPGSFVFFVFGTFPFSVGLPGCPGATLEVFPDVIVKAVPADAGGEAGIGGTVGPGAAGATVLLHAFELDTCQTTAVVSTTF